MVTHKEAYELRVKLSHYCIQHSCGNCIFYKKENDKCLNGSARDWAIIKENFKRLGAEENA